MSNKDDDKAQRCDCDSWDNDPCCGDHDCDNPCGNGGCGVKFKCCFDPDQINNIIDCLCNLKDQLDTCESILRFLVGGLIEIKSEVSLIESGVFNPTFGLPEIKSEVSAIESVVFRPEVLVATLSGDEEVPPVVTNATGFAIITLNEAQGEICWELNVSNLSSNATAAHIHNAPAGVNGPIVFTLSFVASQTWTSSGCNTANQALINDIINNPEQFYVNVHTVNFPGGEIRGQLRRP